MSEVKEKCPTCGYKHAKLHTEGDYYSLGYDKYREFRSCLRCNCIATAISLFLVITFLCVMYLAGVIL